MTSNSNIEEPLYSSEHVLSFDFSKIGLEKIKVKEIRQLGQKFVDNLNLVTDLMSLPHVILSYERAKASLIPDNILAAVMARVRMKQNGVSDKDWAHYLSEARKEVFESQVLPYREKRIDEALDDAEKALADYLKNNDLRIYETYVALLYSAIVWTWCSFELLTKELWELAVNIGEEYTSKSLINELPSTDGIEFPFRGKYISIDYLAKYDYNLSNKLGTALQNRFDFTSPNGIKEAYFLAFPKSINIKNALNNVIITELEASRNVIVHNAGIIDEEYCKKTNSEKSQVGEKLYVNSRGVCEFINCVLDVGVRIMIAISSIVSHKKPKKRK